MSKQVKITLGIIALAVSFAVGRGVGREEMKEQLKKSPNPFEALTRKNPLDK